MTTTPRRPLIIGVIGGSGSGKTTVARAVQASLGLDASFVDMDAYYRDQSHMPFEERLRVNYDHPSAFDLDLMVEQLTALSRGEAVEKPTYDFAAHTRAERRELIEPRGAIVVDGILLLVEARIRALLDIKVFVDVDDDVRFIRRLQRDVQERGRSVEDVIRQYLSTVRPMHLEFVEPSKRYADIIIPEGGHNRVGVEMLLARVEMEVARRGGNA
jgi:uridine kinase